ncbi:MAG: universal stress protein [Bdellovibrionota bacterium]
MYQRILIPLENGPADQTILDHVSDLATLTKAKLFLLHVADGWVARNYDYFALRESEEMKHDRAYLDRRCAELGARGFETEPILALGDPAKEIIRCAAEKEADLIAMSTHGHRFISDVIYGSTADKVRHVVEIPVLLLKARQAG